MDTSNQVAYSITSLYRTVMHRQSGVGCSPSRRYRVLPPLFYFCAGQLATAGLLAMTIPSGPATAFTEFQLCAAQLVRLAGVSPEAASRPCAEALRPEDLSRCVVTISQLTPTLTQEALVACTKVRRPVELSRCVFDISDGSRDAEALRVIDYCRRSLLPVRFSECVTGLSREIDFSTTRALDTCIAAEDFPRNLSPTFAPPPPPTPTQPIIPNLTPVPPAIPVVPSQPINPVKL